MTLVVFDIGNVLLRWNPHAAFRHAFASDAEIGAFFAGARVAGWQAHRFAGADGLRAALGQRGL